MITVGPGVTRDELQALADRGETVQLEEGDYVLDTPIGTAAKRRPYAMIGVGAGELRGAGPGTVLRFRGDARGQDWFGLWLTRGSIRDLAIDTSEVTGTSEQAHAIRMTGPSMGATVERVRIFHPPRATKAGDGIQIVGRMDSPVVSARIAHCSFTCDRSGVAAHSSAYGLTIEDSEFECGGQEIDGEGSGDHRDWVIARNVFSSGPGSLGDFAIQLHLIDQARITGNRFHGRGVFVLSGNRVEMDDNVIDRTTGAGGVAAIQIDKSSTLVSMWRNTIIRAASAGPGPVIRAMPRDGYAPRSVTIRDNTIVQACNGSVVDAAGVVGLDLDRNTIVYAGAPGAGYGLSLQGAPTLRADQISLDNNTFIGPLAGCVGINAGYAGTGEVRARRNRAFGASRGIVVGNANATTGPVRESGNRWPAAVGITTLGDA